MAKYWTPELTIMFWTMWAPAGIMLGYAMLIRYTLAQHEAKVLLFQAEA